MWWHKRGHFCALLTIRAGFDLKPFQMTKRILLLSAYDAISHRLWVDHIEQMVDDVEWTTVQAAPRHFAWALRGRPLQWFFDPATRALLQQDYDAIVATSMVDLAGLFGCVPALARVPCLLYMHENQFVYPENEDLASSLRKSHRVDACMVQIYAMMAASQIVFNSRFNRRSTREGVEAFLKLMPVSMDPGHLLEKIESSFVIGVPLDAAAFACPRASSRAKGPLTLVWNHRWEFDKAPDRFLAALVELEREGLDFRLILLGEDFGRRHSAYETILGKFSSKILHHGMVKRRDAYFEWLARGDVLVSTSLHDFQGLSMLEGAGVGVWPLVPARLAYKDIYPELCQYPSNVACPRKEAVDLALAIKGFDARRRAGKVDPVVACAIAEPYRREKLAPKYRQALEALLAMNSVQ